MGAGQKNQTVCAEVEIVAEGFEAVVVSARSDYLARDGRGTRLIKSCD